MKIIIESEVLESIMRTAILRKGIIELTNELLEASTPISEVVKPLMDEAFTEGWNSFSYSMDNDKDGDYYHDLKCEQFISQKLKELE